MADLHHLTAARFTHTGNLPELLAAANVSLLVSTYQAGQLIAVGTRGGALTFSFSQFDQAMGVAVAPGRLAVGSRRQVWMLVDVPGLAPKVGVAGAHDACYVARSCRVTGPVHGHELAFGPDGLWQVNTLFSCLALVSEEYSFVPKWRPPFVTALAAEDRCHLNGLAPENGRPKYVTALAESDTAGGWRPTKAESGCVIDVPADAVLARGFAMPHSPRLHGGRLWVLDSGRGSIVEVDRASGKWQELCRLPGYTRGLAFAGHLAFVGLSRVRETSVFGGLPVSGRRDELKCGVSVVDLKAGRDVARLEFGSGVEEIFDVQVLPGACNPFVAGPTPVEGQEPVWVVPTPAGDPALRS